MEALPTQAIVDVNGVGYEVIIPLSSYDRLPAPGQEIKILTHLAVREDAHQLFGFGTASERNAFRALIRISGIGSRTALAVLSGLGVDELAQAISLQQTALLTRVPGIGTKTAGRLLLELKGKLGAALEGVGAGAAAGGDTAIDILRALVALGYSEREATAAARLVPAGTGVSDGIRLALQSLAKG